jgi:hypothetical protein
MAVFHLNETKPNGIRSIIYEAFFGNIPVIVATTGMKYLSGNELTSIFSFSFTPIESLTVFNSAFFSALAKLI